MKLSPALLILVQLLVCQIFVFENFQLAAAVVKGGYWLGDLPLENINFNFQTHVFYAFAGVDPSTFELVAPPSSQDNGQIATFVSVAKGSNPAVVPLLSIGGGAAPYATFGAMVSTSATRKVFIDSSIALAREYGYEGLDLDWESPQSQGEMDDLALLLKEWRAATALEAQSSGKTELLLTGECLFYLSATNSASVNLPPILLLRERNIEKQEQIQSERPTDGVCAVAA